MCLLLRSLFLLLIFIPPLKAQESRETEKSDQLITNREMRAITGSTSKWSFISSFNYLGGSLADPLGAERPNILGAGEAAQLQSLDANLGVNYKVSSLSRINLSFGLSTLSPFHSYLVASNADTQRQFDENAQKPELNDVSLTFTRIANLLGVQTLFSLSGLKYERSFLERKGYDYAFNTTINTMYQAEGSRLSVGLFVSWTQNFFNRGANERLHPESDILLGPLQARSIFSIKPQAEYIINETFNLRSALRPLWYDHFRSPGQESKLTRRPLSQTLRLGVSYTRDIFFSFGLEFLPLDLSAQNTVISTQARINLF